MSRYDTFWKSLISYQDLGYNAGDDCEQGKKYATRRREANKDNNINEAIARSIFGYEK